MAQTIKLKRSATQNAVPSTSSLALGELAINTYDGKLFIKKNVSGTESIVTIGEVGAGSIGPTELASTAVTAGSYGSTSAIPVITIDADGRITSASTATISGLSADSVTATEIAANAVGISELNVSDGTDGQVLTTDGNGNLAFEDQSGGAASATAFSTNIASGDGSTTAFTLSESPSAESKIIAFINGVFQNQDAYTISGTTLTFDTAPISGTNNVVVYVIGDVYSGESVLISNFSGNGTTTAFTLANNPGNENNTQVYIDGVYQQKTTYSVSGTTLTFSSAPPTGTNNIEVVMLTSTTVNTPAAGSVVTASMADDSVTASKIVSSAVTTAKIADSNVTTAKIADDAVTIGKIADAALVIESEGIGSNDNDTTLPTSAAVKDYVDTQVAGKDNTDEITEGSTNLYYTDARVGTYISGNRTYGNITTTGYLAGPSTFTIDPAAVGDNTGTLVIAGNLQVDGTTTTVNSTTLTVDDKLVTLGSGSVNAGAANGAGIEVDISGVTNPSLTYDGTNDEWDFNKDIHVNGGITFGTADSTLADNNIRFKSTGAAYIDHNTVGQDINFRVSNASALDTTIMTLDAGVGSVGINQISPSSTYKLDVGGAIRSAGNSPSFNLREDDSSNQHWQLGSYGGVFALRNVTGGTYPLQSSGGQVGIGMAPNATKNFALDIQATSGGNALRLKGRSAGGNEGWLVWTDNSDNVEAGIYATSDNLIFANTTSYTERMRITDGGDVSIGSDHAGFSGWRVLNLRGEAGSGALINWEANDATRKAAIAQSGNDLRLQVFDTGSITFEPGTGAEKVRITADGNLKFTGTTTNFESPGFTHHTNGYLYLRGGTSGLRLDDDSSINTIQIADGSNGYIKFETGDGSERMRIDSSGRVGIGTGGATSSFILDARGNVRIGDGSTSEQDIHFYNSTTEWQVGTNNGGNGTDSNQFYFYEGGNYRLTVQKGGNVGVGTVSPSTQLHVYGSNNSAGDLWTQVGPGNIPSITIQNAGTTDNNNAAIFFRNDSNMFAAINARFRNHTTDETELRFSTTNSSGTTRERMKLDGDGDIQVDGRLGYTGGRHRKAIHHFQDTSNASGSTYYVHFKTNISTSSNTMTRWEFEGYNYGDAKVVKADWAVHTSNSNLYARAYNSLNTGFQAANIYESSDSYVVIVGSYTVRYYLSGAINVHDSPIYGTQASSITAHTITTSDSGAY